MAGRWSSPTELLDATERLGVEALLASADSAGELAEVEDELFRFGQVVDGDAALAAALGDSDRRRPSSASTLAHALLDGQGHARPRSGWSSVALAGFGGRNFAGSLSRLVELAADRRDRQVAYVTVAAPLTRRRGATARPPGWPQMYGRQVTVKVTVDPTSSVG